MPEQSSDSKFERALVLHISAQLLEGEDYDRAVERALKLIEAYGRILSAHEREDQDSVDWIQGVKMITGEKRLVRAERKFAKMRDHLAKGSIEQWRKTGFLLDEITELSQDFARLFPSRTKNSTKSSWSSQKAKNPA